MNKKRTKSILEQKSEACNADACDIGKVRVLDEAHGRNWSIYHADCVSFLEQCPPNSIDVSIYSPPFAKLYIYSDSVADMGNCADDKEFFEQYTFTIRELYRCTRPGRLSYVHCKDLVNYAGRDGMAGLRDFPGDIVRAHQSCGWSWAGKATIWKDPVIEMQRTKAHGLLYKQLRADSTFSRMGMAEYVLFFRKWATEEQEPLVKPVIHTKPDFALEQWQDWASPTWRLLLPVWDDIRQTNVLNCKEARDQADEKHICPLQLDVIERCLVLGSNPGDVVFSPFMGIGSEGYQAITFGRKFIGTELKKSYFDSAKAYLSRASSEAVTLL